MRNVVMSLRRITGVAPAILAGLASSLVTLVATKAEAQLDTNPPLPNVLLLVDSSGSMEYMAQPDAAGKIRLPVCNPGQPLLTNEQNRWASLVSVLTGEIRDYSCDRVTRSSATFLSEYDLSGNQPYDKDYTLPFHRVLSGSSTDTCEPLPDLAKWPAAAAQGGPFAFPNDSVKYRKRGATTQSCNFVQAKDGLLDSFESRARFGLMTFDTSTDAGTGIAGAGPDYATGIKGLWSYYKDWQSGTASAAQGRPELCATSSTLEVGARNNGAPPWEGKLVSFPHPSAAKSDSLTNTQHIQDALLMMRPYGATPTAGLLRDARYFLTEDATTDPVDSSRSFGPKDDPFVKGGCRKGFVILLTDGQPNTDLRPDCVSNCPFPKTYETAKALRDAGYNTYVVGFALSSADDPAAGPLPVKCDEITPSGHGDVRPERQVHEPHEHGAEVLL
jgi:type IV pilus assembly protein PilY1